MPHAVKDIPPQQFKALAALYSQGQLQQALLQGEPLLKSHPLSPRLRSLMGAIYNALGQHKKAEENFKQAVTLSPTYAEGYNNLGTFYFGIKKQNEAIESYKRALEVKPDYVDAHRNIGNAFSARGTFVAALKHFREAVKLAPQDAQAHLGLAATLQAVNNHAGALASYQNTLKFDPKNVSALIGIGVAKSAMADVEGAVESYRAALKINPNHPIAHNNLGVALRELGDMEQALFHSQEAVRINPDYAGAYRNLGLLSKCKPDDPRIEAMLALSKKSLSNSENCYLSFALGKAYDDIGQVDDAFKWYKQGNALRKRELKYNIATDRKLFAQIKEKFSGDVPALQPKKGDKSPIFIIGMPRSGTSLVEQILASHSSVYGGGELDYLWRAISASGWQSNDLDAPRIADIRKRYLNSVRRLNVNERYVTDKMPINFRWIGFMLAALPEAKIINVKRDARATCWSIFKQYFSTNGNPYAYDLRDLAAYYRLYVDLMAFWRQRYPDRIYDLSYEVLTEQQESETRKLLEYAGLDWEDACLSFHENERAVRTASTQQVRKKIYQGSSEAWRAYADILGDVFADLNGI